MWAHKLTCLDYQDLIDRGWRRFVIMFSVVCLFAETYITILFVISLACLWRVQLELTDALHCRIVMINDRSFVASQTGGRGGGVKFCKRHDFKGVNFKNQQNVRGVEILRHRTGLLCKSCQTILWLKQIHVPSHFEDCYCPGGGGYNFHM